MRTRDKGILGNVYQIAQPTGFEPRLLALSSLTWQWGRAFGACLRVPEIRHAHSHLLSVMERSLSFE